MVSLAVGLVEDPNEWDNFVGQVPGDTIPQTYMWAEAKANRYKHSVHVVRSGGEIVAGCLLLHTRKAGVKVSYAPRGPIVLDGYEAAAGPLISAVVSEARSSLGVTVLQPVAETEHLLDVMSQSGFTSAPIDVTTPATAEIALDIDEDQLMANMNSSRRQDIRKADRLGVKVRRGGLDDLATFYQLHKASAERQGFTALSLSYVRRQAECLQQVDAFGLYLAELEGEAMAGATVTSFGDRMVYKLTGMAPTKEARDSRATTFLQWHMMRDAKERGFSCYDLGGFDKEAAKVMADGGETPEHIRKSPLQFKLSLGGVARLSPQARWRISPGLLQGLQNPAASLVERSPAVERALARFRD